MTAGEIATMAVGIAIVGFLWSLHRDVRSLDRDIRTLSDRVARLEGAVGTLKDFLIGREKA